MQEQHLLLVLLYAVGNWHHIAVVREGTGSINLKCISMVTC